MIRDVGGRVCVCVCVFLVCVSVCVCVCLVCVFSVCVCVFCVCIFKRYLNQDNASKISTPHVKNTLHSKIYTQHNFPTLQHYRAVLPYQPTREKNYFQLSTLNF